MIEALLFTYKATSIILNIPVSIEKTHPCLYLFNEFFFLFILEERVELYCMEVGVTSLTDVRPDVTKTVLQKCENTLVNFFFH